MASLLLSSRAGSWLYPLVLFVVSKQTGKAKDALFAFLKPGITVVH